MKENDVTAFVEIILSCRTCSPTTADVPPTRIIRRETWLNSNKALSPLSLSLNLPFNAHIYINSHSCAQGKRNELTHRLASVVSPRGEKENWNAKGYRVRVRAPWCFWPIWIIDPAVVNPPFYVVPNKKRYYYYYYYLLDLFGRVIARDYRRCECVRRISELWSERERLSSKWSYFLSY